MNFPKRPVVSISIVSHRHGHLLPHLIKQLADIARETPLEILVTINIPDDSNDRLNFYGLPHQVIRNIAPLGFARNHNQAFRLSTGNIFCVLNPDIGFEMNPFPRLLATLAAERADIVSPKILSPSGHIEDNAREVPTPWRAAVRLFFPAGRREYLDTSDVLFPDWIAGMFMLMHRDTFQQINGFDAGYRLYYEDAEFCLRLKLQGGSVAICNEVSVVHDARRASRRSFQHLRWHLGSALRFFTSSVFIRAYLAKRRRLWRTPQDRTGNRRYLP